MKDLKIFIHEDEGKNCRKLMKEQNMEVEREEIL